MRLFSESYGQGCLIFLLLALGTTCCHSVTAAEQGCERLKASLTYTQEQAPKDLSKVLPVLVERVNRVLEGVVDVEVEWTGADFQGRVGEHIVHAKVTRLASVLASDQLGTVWTDETGRQVSSQCFHVPFAILDTNECTLPQSHPMRHQCHASSMCVNTIGSYECLCPRLPQQFHVDDDNNIMESDFDDTVLLSASDAVDEDFWEKVALQNRSAWERSLQKSLSSTSSSLPTKSSCSGFPSTHGCCAAKAHSGDGKECRANFRCPEDPCTTTTNVCASTARCERLAKPPSYQCTCPKGLMGNGKPCIPGVNPKPEPKVTFDGITPTEETIKNDYYCGCTKPIVDACSGFPPCANKHEICVVGAGNTPHCGCKAGFVPHETFGCVDETPPILRLKNDKNKDKTLYLKQGDEYQEYGLDIIDDNAEDYLRSLKISYSQPLPPGCISEMGEFHVNYTVATPWTTPPFVRVTRRVIIEDIDECSLDAAEYENSCPDLLPKCDEQATCVNVRGSYSCQCPRYTSGDGFLANLTFSGKAPPMGYNGGTGCIDTTKPTLTLQGPNPKTLKIASCASGLSGIMSSMGRSSNRRDGDENSLVAEDDPYGSLRSAQRDFYENDIKQLIQATEGAELCANHRKPNPKPSDCIRAVDMTHSGPVDLSKFVRVGEPVQKSPLHWVVPYDVEDAAGNQAATVWRDIVVEEVDLESLESRVREVVKQEHHYEMQKMIDQAILEDRKRRAKIDTPSRRGGTVKAGSTPCPPCPNCEGMSGSGVIDDSRRVDSAACEQYCATLSWSCPNLDGLSSFMEAMLALENYLSPSVFPLAASVVLLVGLIVILRFFYFFLVTSHHQDYYHGVRPNAVSNGSNDNSKSPSVTYFRSDSITTMPTPVNVDRGFSQSNGPPRSSLSTGRNADFFLTPRATPPTPSFASPLGSLGNGSQPVQDNYDDSIYMSSPTVISPSARDNDRRRRSPFSY